MTGRFEDLRPAFLGIIPNIHATVSEHEETIPTMTASLHRG